MSSSLAASNGVGEDEREPFLDVVFVSNEFVCDWRAVDTGNELARETEECFEIFDNGAKIPNKNNKENMNYFIVQGIICQTYQKICSDRYRPTKRLLS